MKCSTFVAPTFLHDALCVVPRRQGCKPLWKAPTREEARHTIAAKKTCGRKVERQASSPSKRVSREEISYNRLCWLQSRPRHDRRRSAHLLCSVNVREELAGVKMMHGRFGKHRKNWRERSVRLTSVEVRTIGTIMLSVESRSVVGSMHEECVCSPGSPRIANPTRKRHTWIRHLCEVELGDDPGSSVRAKHGRQ